MNVLIVCSANMCRSPIAEVILRDLARRQGIADLHVRSAGTMGLRGAAPVENAIVACRERGLSLEAFRSSPLTREAILQANFILVMEQTHLQMVRDLSGVEDLPVFYIGEFHEQEDHPLEIPDPVGKDLQAFRACFELLEACLAGFLDHLNLQSGRRR